MAMFATHEGDGVVFHREDVTHRGSSCRESRRADESGQRAEDEHDGHSVSEDWRDLEDDEEEETGDVDGVATDRGYFLHRSEEH